MLRQLAESLLDSPLNRWIEATYWLWPVLEIIHFIGLSLLMGGLIVIDLRMAGHFRQLDPSATHRLLPMVATGFGLNLGTGILFFYGDPMRYAINIGFQVKMVLIVLAGINALIFALKLKPVLAVQDVGAPAPVAAKVVAYTSLALWLGVLLSGRLIPYVGTG